MLYFTVLLSSNRMERHPLKIWIEKMTRLVNVIVCSCNQFNKKHFSLKKDFRQGFFLQIGLHTNINQILTASDFLRISKLILK